jgi:hypothetical protein
MHLLLYVLEALKEQIRRPETIVVRASLQGTVQMPAPVAAVVPRDFAVSLMT